MTLIEAMLAVALLTVVALAVLVVLTTTTRATREMALLESARTVATARVEEIAALEPDVVLATRYVQGGAPFAVAGLEPPGGGAPVGLTEVLSESEASRALGVPLDLDDDGVFFEEEEPHPGCVAAVVRVSLRWTVDLGQEQRTAALAVVVARAE